MKIKITLFIAIGIAFSLTVSGQQNRQQTPRDPFPDPEVIAALEKLQPASAADTNRKKLVFFSKKDTAHFVHLSAYNIVKKLKLKSAHGFSGQEALDINRVIAFSPSQRKVAELIEGMRKWASYFYHLGFTDDGDPKQTRIGYSWGSKEYSDRHKPPGEDDQCQYKIHGLDCSGFIYQLLKMNKINIKKSQAYADNERKTTFLKECLKRDYFGQIPFDVIDKKHLAVKEMQFGDIIYFKKGTNPAYHIGIVLANDDGAISLYQCLGNPNRSKTDFNWCTKNLDIHHGVLVNKLDPSIEVRDYACIRIIPL